ncbi:MAG: hypothetical protein J6S58_00140, partial [Lentisphaeria bacterium]|nr:hypothetical protein [Lentisphaeria bacterium]
MDLKKIFCFAILILSGVICFGQIKVADCVIYVAKENPPSVMRGAKDLQKHIFLATGNKLAIVSRAKSPMIALGSSPEAKKAGVDASKKKYETHIIRTVGGNLYIAGRDVPMDRQTDKGGYSYGTLYGIYAFMNDVMDIAFLMPTDRGTYIPKLGKNWKIPSVSKTYTPQFEYRGFPYVPRKAGDVLLWKIRNFSDGRGDSGSVIANHGHIWSNLYPTPGTLFSRWNKDRAATFKDNPEFFTAVHSGKRVYPKFNFSLCLSNPAVWKDVAQRAVKMRHGSNKYYKRNFKYEMVSLSPNDGSYCYCSACRKLYVPITEKEVGVWKSFPRVIQSNTGMMLDYYRGATKELARTFKHVEATGLIYDRY